MNYRVTQLDTIAPVRCPCGFSRRAFTDVPGAPASVHLVEIQADAKPHYHRKLTETYVILDGTGHVELDGDRIPVKPLTAVTILPGCRHRAVGRLRVLNVVTPPFDPHDEWLDEPHAAPAVARRRRVRPVRTPRVPPRRRPGTAP